MPRSMGRSMTCAVSTRAIQPGLESGKWKAASGRRKVESYTAESNVNLLSI